MKCIKYIHYKLHVHKSKCTKILHLKGSIDAEGKTARL